MLKSSLLGILTVLVAYTLKTYVESSEPRWKKEEIVNLIEGVTIRSYRKNGLEWTIKGHRLTAVGRDIRLTEVELFSKDGIVRAKEVYLDRATGKGELVGDVVLLSEGLRVESQHVLMDLGKGEFTGHQGVQAFEKGNRLQGESFHLQLKPLKIIISKAKVHIE